MSSAVARRWFPLIASKMVASFIASCPSGTRLWQTQHQCQRMSLAKLLISSGLADLAPACGAVQTARIPALPPHHGQGVSGEQERILRHHKRGTLDLGGWGELWGPLCWPPTA